MNLDQQLSMLRNVLRQVSHANAAVDRADEAITAAALRIGEIVRDLPDGLLRESAWKKAKPAVLRALTRASNVIGQNIVLELAHATPEQMVWALNYLGIGDDPALKLTSKAGVRANQTSFDAVGTAPSPTSPSFSADAPGAAANRRATAQATGANPAFMPRTVEAFEKAAFTLADLGYAGSDPNLLGRLQRRVPEDVAKVVKRTRFDQRTLSQWFGKSAGELGVGGGPTRININTITGELEEIPRFARFSYDNIDRNVRAGFLGQTTNEEIARNIISTEIRGKARLGTSAVRLKTDARAISRSAMASLSDEAHLAQWRAMEQATNRKIIKSWRLDASADSRLCSICAGLDGQTWDERADAPTIPIHANCRCQLIGETATSKALREQEGGREKISHVELTDQAPPERIKGETKANYRKRMADGGWFITKGRGPSGERWYRRRVDRPGETAVEWLGSLAKDPTNRRSANVTMQEFFGSPQRADFFQRQIDQGVSPHTAWDRLVRRDNESGRVLGWKPVAKLRRLDPDIKDAGLIRSPRERKALAAGRNPGPPRRGY
jgi:hypothetical protein